MTYSIKSIKQLDTDGPVIVVHPFSVTIRKVWNRYRADFNESGLCEFGDTPDEALDLLLDVIVTTFEDLVNHRNNLGKGLANELLILEKYLKLEEPCKL